MLTVMASLLISPSRQRPWLLTSAAQSLAGVCLCSDFANHSSYREMFTHPIMRAFLLCCPVSPHQPPQTSVWYCSINVPVTGFGVLVQVGAEVSSKWSSRVRRL